MKIKNVIFIVADTLRSKNIGVYNEKIRTTPNIDSLAKKGTFFKNSYTTFTNTDPAITAMMTGKYPLSVGLVNHGHYVTPAEEESAYNTTNLAEYLKQNGFYTAAVDWLGRWHSKGFDDYSGQINQPNSKITIADKFPFPLPIRLLDKFSVKFLKREFFIRFYYALMPHPIKHYDDAETVVKKGIELLKKNTRKKTFLYLHFWDAHSPHTLPTGLKSFLKDTVENTYEAEISYLDTEIGRLLDFLKQTKELNETLIIFTGDHGENLFGHDIPFNHENLYDDVVKVPLIFFHQDLKPQSSDKIVQHPDILPTVLKLLHIKLAKDIDGLDLFSKKTRKLAYFEDISYRKFDIPQQTRRRGVRSGKYKYIQTLIGSKQALRTVVPREDIEIKKEELFDLQKDPSEKNNIIKNSDRPKYRIMLENITNELTMKRFVMDPLYPKVKKALSVIKKSLNSYRLEDIALAWKGGKDTTTLMHIIKTHFKGNIPFKVFFNDTTMEFNEAYKFIGNLKKRWNLNLYTIRHSQEELNEFHSTRDIKRKQELAKIMKITAIEKGLKVLKIKAYMLGIRRDENPARQNEKYFSPRKNHIRIHPMLDFTEKDIWYYIRFFGVPYMPLYDQGYRSVGEQPFTSKAPKEADERAGRDQDKEKTMARLRKLGYW